MKTLLVALLTLVAPLMASAELTVATLHPLLTDWARQIGGSRVAVTSLMPAGQDPHEFQPSPSQLASASRARLILASGKGMETYLPKLEANLSSNQTLLEVGRRVPSVRVQKGNDLFYCCPAHSQGGIDPHWWHSVSAMQRATGIVADAFAEADPSNAAAYQSNAKQYQGRLEALDRCVKPASASDNPSSPMVPWPATKPWCATT